jgi:type III secretory pathway component EscT
MVWFGMVEIWPIQFWGFDTESVLLIADFDTITLKNLKHLPPIMFQLTLSEVFGEVLNKKSPLVNHFDKIFKKNICPQLK